MARKKTPDVTSEAVSEAEVDLSVLDTPVQSDPAIMSVTSAMNMRPAMTDPAWSDYVLGLMEPDELTPQGLVKVAGLRRVARLLLGPILKSTCKVVQPPVYDPGASAIGGWQPCTVEYNITFLWTGDDAESMGSREVEFGDCAEVWLSNCPDLNIHRHMVETATTKAEARTYRKALQLKGIAAEEYAPPVATSGVTREQLIESFQIITMNAKCKALNINLRAFVNGGELTYKNINDVTYDRALKMIEHLGEYERNPKKIPERLRGYDPEWRQSFS